MDYLNSVLFIISALSISAAICPTENDYKSAGRIKNLGKALKFALMKF